MKIVEIYEQYKIMPSLQLHMLRVSAVAEIICEHSSLDINRNNIITACLLHDMGNILKFNFDLFPEFFQPEGTKYWQNVKTEFEQKYGTDEHEATIQIAEEIGVTNRVIELLDAFQFSLADKNKTSTDYGKKICAYSDMRVEPKGVVSLQKRLEEGSKRFYQNKPGLFDPDFFEKMARSLESIQQELFDSTNVSPEDISNKTVAPYIEKLKQAEIEKKR